MSIKILSISVFASVLFGSFFYAPGHLYAQEEHLPEIDPAEFSAEITNETKTMMGVETLVYWDRVWLDDVLIEDTRDYLAQDAEGNVWYFGEDVDNYENGTFKSSVKETDHLWCRHHCYYWIRYCSSKEKGVDYA